MKTRDGMRKAIQSWLQTHLSLRSKCCRADPRRPAPWMALLVIVFLSACTDHRMLANQYNVELQYYEYSYNFANRNMNEQAFESCQQTHILRSECFTTLVQSLLSKNIPVPKDYCSEIHPGERMNMTMAAFKLVYGSMDADLKKEVKEKLNPSASRTGQVQSIKDRCSQ